MTMAPTKMPKIPSVLLCTLPSEGEYVSWATPTIADPKEVKHIPLGILSLMSNIQYVSYQDSSILDPYADDLSIEQTAQIIRDRSPDVVGFSAVTRRVYSLYKLLESIDVVAGGKRPWKIIGGPHATFYADQLLRKGADAVFVGQLADTDLCKWLQNPRPGIIQCDTKINEICFPRRHEKIDLPKYFYSGKVFFEAKKRMHMFSSVGCPNSCKFCSVQTHKVQRKTADRILAEMWYLKANGAESVHIMDDNFNTSTRHVTSVLDEMENCDWNTEWSIRGQVKFDLSLVPRMRKCGMKRIHVGIETFDNNTLKWMGKNHTFADIEKFCKVMKDNEIEVLAYFIIGTPLDTERTYDEFSETIKKLDIKHPYVNILFPMPDTEYYNELVQSGAYKTDVWEQYMENPTPSFEIPVPPGVNRDRAYLCAEEIMKEFSGL